MDDFLASLSEEGVFITNLSSNPVDTLIPIKKLKPQFVIFMFREKEGGYIKRLSQILENDGIFVESFLVPEEKDFIISIYDKILEKYSHLNCFIETNGYKPDVILSIYERYQHENVYIGYYDNSDEELKIIYPDDKEPVSIKYHLTLENYINTLGIKLFTHSKPDFKLINERLPLHKFILSNIDEISPVLNIIKHSLGKKKNPTKDISVKLKSLKKTEIVEEFFDQLKKTDLINDFELKDDETSLVFCDRETLRHVASNWLSDYVNYCVSKSIHEGQTTIYDVCCDWYNIKLLPIDIIDFTFTSVVMGNYFPYFIYTGSSFGKINNLHFYNELLSVSLINSLLETKSYFIYPAKIPPEIKQKAGVMKIECIGSDKLLELDKFFVFE